MAVETERRRNFRLLPALESPLLGPVFGLLVSLGTWLLVLAFPAPFQNLELLVHRLWVQRRGTEDLGPREPRIALVTLTEEANLHVQERYGYGAGAWGREVFADAVRELRDLGAVGIGFDVVMDHARVGTPQLAEALAARDDVVLAAFRQRAVVSSGVGWRGSRHELRRPVEELRAVADLGHVNLAPDPDGVIRRGSLYLFAGDLGTLPSLDLQLARRGLPGAGPLPPAPARAEAYWPGPRPFPGVPDAPPVPALVDTEFLIRFRGPSPAFPEVSLEKILDPAARRRLFYSESLAGEGDLRVAFAPPGREVLEVHVTPAGEEVEVLALASGGLSWGSVRGAGTLRVEGLSAEPHRVFVARRLGDAGFGIGAVAAVVPGAGVVRVDLPAPGGVLEGTVRDAPPGARVRLRSVGLDAAPAWGSYLEQVDLEVGPGGAVRSPPVASADFLVLAADGAPRPVSRGTPAELDAGAVLPPATARTLALPAEAAGARLVFLDGDLPLPPYRAATPVTAGDGGATADVPAARVAPDLRALVRGPGGTRGRVEQVQDNPFRGALALVGSTTELEQDFHATPFDHVLLGGAEGSLRNRTPGVEIHAHAIRTLLTAGYDRAPTGVAVMGEPDLAHRLRGQVPLLLLLLAVCVPGMTAIRRSMPGKGGLALLACMVVVAEGSYRLLAGAHLWVHAAVPILALLAGYTGLVSYNYAIVERRRELIRSAFEHYLDPDIVRQLTEDPRALMLGGEQHQVTCFFSDIQGFSGFSECMTPVELVAFINEYLTAMSDVLLQYGGWIDKFIGDAIVAVFNAPREQPDHARRCLMAALEMKAREAALREEWAARGLPEVHTRVGVNTGPAVVGNVGTSSRKNYTILGDAVNLAARLEALNKSYGTYLMAGEDTWVQVADEFEGRELDRVRVKGKTVPSSVYEVWALRGELGEDRARAGEAWGRALAAYRGQDWDVAEAAFAEVEALLPGDGPSNAYRKRITLLRENPPPPDWDGVWTMEHK